MSRPIRTLNTQEEYDAAHRSGYRRAVALLIGFHSSMPQHHRDVAEPSHMNFSAITEFALHRQEDSMMYNYPGFRDKVELHAEDMAVCPDPGFLYPKISAFMQPVVFFSPKIRETLKAYFDKNAYPEVTREESPRPEPGRREALRQEEFLRYKNRLTANGGYPPIPVRTLLSKAKSEYKGPSADFLVGRIQNAVNTPTCGDVFYSGILLHETDFQKLNGKLWVGGDSAECLLNHFAGRELTPEEAIAIFTRKMEVSGGLPGLGRR